MQLSQAAPYPGAMLAYHTPSIAVRTRNTSYSRHSHARAASRSVVARASEEDVEDAASTFSLVPADAQDGLSRYRAVLAPLFFAGGALHAPDVFGAGPISNVCGVSAFTDLSTALQALTLLWRWAVPSPASGCCAHHSWATSPSPRLRARKSSRVLIFLTSLHPHRSLRRSCMHRL